MEGAKDVRGESAWKATTKVCETFLKVCLDEKLAEADKVKFEEGPVCKCYFYHSALRTWLEEEVEKRSERFRFKNEFAASIFGPFQCPGADCHFGRWGYTIYCRGSRR